MEHTSCRSQVKSLQESPIHRNANETSIFSLTTNAGKGCPVRPNPGEPPRIYFRDPHCSTSDLADESTGNYRGAESRKIDANKPSTMRGKMQFFTPESGSKDATGDVGSCQKRRREREGAGSLGSTSSTTMCMEGERRNNVDVE